MEDKGEIPGKSWPDGINYLLRTTQQHHVQLSLMADQKASILVGASFVVFGLALRDGIVQPINLAPLILAISSFLSAFLAVLAIIPSTGKRPQAALNMLFFGGFTAMDEDDYVTEMLERTKDPEQIYQMLLRDIHQNGSILYRKKYRFLAYAFRVFLVGLVLSFAAYIAPLFLPLGLA